MRSNSRQGRKLCCYNLKLNFDTIFTHFYLLFIVNILLVVVVYNIKLNEEYVLEMMANFRSATRFIENSSQTLSVFGDLEVACWPLVPKFSVSYPTETVGFFFRAKKSSARLPSEGK